ncbi:MAG: fumarylacetoacetase [Crocinitomicaceae bacterium]|nr:fumarylacetoacetase [Crocinitomicaceae bacterium]NGF76426.1 fumarylacetoacetase [Fluviicola sp. SGL-29]
MSEIVANNPNLKSWVDVPANSDFPIQNLPFGVFKTDSLSPRAGSRIGDFVIDLKTLFVLGYFENLPFSSEDFDTDNLNSLMKKGKKATRNLRNRLSKLFSTEHDDLQKNTHHVDQILVPVASVFMLMPVQIGDYTDFYSSREHATNVGTMFRDPNNALLPNWLWIPVGYHGRASSVIISGEPIYRPKGQIKPNPEENPIYAPCRNLDFELETAFITYDGKPLGDSISTEEAEEYIFGMVLFNDWSARDIQTWEYVPLGPFLAKNFASSISPWIVTLDALQPYKVAGPVQDPKVLSYLEYNGEKSYDINLQVLIQPENGEENLICRSNFKYMYWNMAQQLAHHTVNGCNVRCGDLMGSGTISGPTPDSYGSMLELAWKGTKPLPMSDGTERKFIQDNDTVIMRGYSEKNGIRIGFGEVSTKVLPAK